MGKRGWALERELLPALTLTPSWLEAEKVARRRTNTPSGRGERGEKFQRVLTDHLTGVRSDTWLSQLAALGVEVSEFDLAPGPEDFTISWRVGSGEVNTRPLNVKYSSDLRGNHDLCSRRRLVQVLYGEEVGSLEGANKALRRLLTGFCPSQVCEYWVTVVVRGSQTRAVLPVFRSGETLTSLNATRPESVLFRVPVSSLVPVPDVEGTTLVPILMGRAFDVEDLCLSLLPRLSAADLGPRLLAELIDGGVPVDVAVALCDRTDFVQVKDGLVRALSNRA